MIVWLLLVGIAIWYSWFRFKRRRLYELASKIPGTIFNLPIVGSVFKFRGHSDEIELNCRKISYEAINANGLIGAWCCHIYYLLSVDPVDCEMILKTCLEKDDIHRFARTVIGYGGIFAPVSIWRRRRKIILPVFSPKIVEGFVEIFSKQSHILTKYLAHNCGTGTVKLWPFVSAYSLDSVCETTMGTKVDAQANSDSVFLACLGPVLNIVCERIFHAWQHPDFLFKYSSQYPKHQEYIKKLHDYIDEIIQKKRHEAAKMKNEKKIQRKSKKTLDLNDNKNKSFLDMLISLSDEEDTYTDLELRDEILTLSIAGNDTTANAICFTLTLLGKYPEIQEKVYEEIYEVFGDSNRLLIKEDLSQLKYLERVLKETLRLYPPVPYIARKIETEITLPSGYTLPAGTGIVISIFGCHRDPKHWGPDAEHFDPDRFLPDRYTPQHACSFMPFSAGSRNCIGTQYAMMSAKTTITNVIRYYKVVGEPEKGPIPNIKLKLDIVLKAVNGYEVILEKRKSCLN